MPLRDELQLNRDFATAEQEAFLAIQRTAHLLMVQAEDFFRQHGVTHTQYNVLRILGGAGKEGLPSLEIGRRMVTSAPDLTRLIDRIEKADLVCRERCTQDRRVTYVKLTTKGRRLLDRLEKPVLQLHAKQLGGLSQRDLTQLNRLLEKVRESQ